MVNTISNTVSTYHVKALTLIQYSLSAREAYRGFSDRDVEREFLALFEERPKSNLSSNSSFANRIEQVHTRALRPKNWKNRFSHSLLLHLNYFFKV